MALIHCQDCDMQISSHASNCPFCGNSQTDGQARNKELRFGYLITGFLLPFIGIVLCCIFRRKNEGIARSALIGTLMSVVYITLIYLQFLEM
ncbi:MAG: hypothetical protein Q4D56_01230 [Bacteroides sp.]|nr:hypothetical protein [Bacteroides sp.]